ncbi:MAG: hypothetical protein COZ49_03135 [Candidatus Yonathbacteria bacterium CG_4_10_14_3_um_filter_47_65]|uniref:Glycosyltransferase family 1 protein n=2 Tax=Parcubacteria group TaxID=1794811 RepID=A0A2M8D5A6_9BACT|nr:MAG: hypothetical protein AUJ44_02570 [Candidatus Nomurabacteria bacterium CG1_02_47_685]PIP03326.1 MAG: hypothetical protein COX54_04060 [Candidatus Yonathbacteria bacterium CG23_combo_of_CG06-09_8_20_14_all_46_18]PIQ31435.1 MAG: hypothetical protein COW61_03665 [Candidatus Yonathbacteria bacterium CG17_big_fil_post_rev_8_21_14_2_50_46_19]PIX56244.1 MAG: hypothetical protein COZ49_03135 [Candidatus Yonathbacteria bacterium CG_4_10_14_3_um_filter_47_65]PIY58011.1 MAG: hypothetical protein CO
MESTSSKKKILYAITKSNFGGAQRYVYDLTTSLPKNEFDVAIALGGDGLLKTKLEAAKIRCISIPRLGRDIRIFSDIRAFFSLLQIIMREKPDILHLNSSKIGIMGGIAGRIARVDRIIFTAHGWAFTEDRVLVSRTIIRFLQWLTIMLAHETIAVSRETAQWISSMPFAGKKTRVIYNGRSPLRFMAREKARVALIGQKSVLDIGKKPVWVGTIAELHRNKGLEYAIMALALIAERDADTVFMFIVIGEGEERARLEKLIENHKLRDRVFFAGFKEDAPKFLKAFDLFILPSIKEGLPYTLTEAGMAALPVIASHVGGIPEVIEDMRSGILVQPKKPEEIADALIFLAKNKTRAKELGKTLHGNIAERFSPVRMIAETVQLYAQ